MFLLCMPFAAFAMCESFAFWTVYDHLEAGYTATFVLLGLAIFMLGGNFVENVTDIGATWSLVGEGESE